MLYFLVLYFLYFAELMFSFFFCLKAEDHLDVAKGEKHKTSLSSLNIKNLGGSLLSLGNKDKPGLKKFTKSVSEYSKKQ